MLKTPEIVVSRDSYETILRDVMGQNLTYEIPIRQIGIRVKPGVDRLKLTSGL